MPAVSVQCPHCSRSYSVDGSLVGRKARCKNCGKSFALTPSGELAGTAPASGNDVASGPTPSSWSFTTPLPEKIGRFLIKQRLGAGACGTVYRAFDPTLDREIALKVPHAEFQRDEKAISRFLREAKAAARLHHPYVVTVFEAGIDGETSYIASALINGRSLAAAIDDGPFEPRRAARIIAALAEGLHAAHQQGIIHRDVKPANVLLDGDDWPHLADFGLARLAAAGARLTKVGSILGTPAYLAPEQAAGKSDQAEPASDQYSLGATLYELLSGKVPFAGPLEVVIFNTMHTPPPPLREEHPDVPSELEAICLKALSKKPEARYANCRELAKDLGKWLAGRPTSLEIPATPSQPATVEVTGQATVPGLPVPEERRSNGPTSMPLVPPMTAGGRGLLISWLRRNRVLAGLAASLLVSFMLVGAWLVTSRWTRNPIPTKVATGFPKPDDQSAPAPTIPAAILAPAASAANHPAEKSPEPNTAVASLASTEKVPMATDRVKAAAKSPEKSTVASSAAGAKTKAKPDPALMLPYEQRVQAAYEACLTNEGERARVLLASCPAELRGWEWFYCQRLSRGGMTTIPGQTGAVRAFAFSPDGKLIAYSGDLSVKIWDGKQPKKLGDHRNVVVLSFTGDAKRVISLGADNSVKEWEVASGSSIRSFELPIPSLHCNEISGDGRWVAAGNRYGTIKVWDANTQKEAASRELRQPVRNLAFSADGTKIIAAVRDGVCVLDWRDSKADRAIRRLANPSSAAMGLDGRQLAGAAGNSVWIWDLSTKKITHVLEGVEGNISSVVYSHDGKRLATGGRDRTVQVWDATSGRPEASYQGPTGEITCIQFSPDDRSIAASSSDSNVYVWPIREDMAEKMVGAVLTGNGPRVEFGASSMSFSQDSGKIYWQPGINWNLFSASPVSIWDSRSMLRLGKFDNLIGWSEDFSRIASLSAGCAVIRDGNQGTFQRALSIDFASMRTDTLRSSEPRITPIDDNRYFVRLTVDATTVHETSLIGVWDEGKTDWVWKTPFDGANSLGHVGVFRAKGGEDSTGQETRIVAILNRNTVAIYTGKSGDTLLSVPGDSFTIHPSGDLIAVVDKGTVEVWSVKEKTRIARFDGEQCSFDASGRLVAIRAKSIVTIIELRTQKRISDFQAGSTTAFSPDGRRVVASLGDGVMVLDPLTGKVLLKLHGPSDNFAFSPDGRIIASTGRFWAADPPQTRPGPDGS